MRPSIATLLKSCFSNYASMLVGKQVDEEIKNTIIQSEEYAEQKRRHFPNPQRRPFNIGANGQVVNAPTPVLETNHEPLMKNGKAVTRKAYILTKPDDPNSLRKLVTLPVMIHRGMDRKALKKALYNDKRVAAGRWVN